MVFINYTEHASTKKIPKNLKINQKFKFFQIIIQNISEHEYIIKEPILVDIIITAMQILNKMPLKKKIFLGTNFKIDF
jgi:hypothetical protein